MSQPATRPERIIDGRWQLLDGEIHGGMGDLYPAHDNGLRAMLKFARLDRDETYQERLRREGSALAGLGSHHVVKCLGQGSSFHPQDLLYNRSDPPKVPYLALEFIQGPTLERQMETSGGRLTLKESVQVGRDVLAGLKAMHALGIVHRDLCPKNIMSREGGEYVIIDLGIAAMPNLFSSPMTVPGAQIGKFHYMSPEQLNSREVSLRTDLYSLGVVLYQLLAGTLPFQADHAHAMAVAKEQPDWEAIFDGLPDDAAPIKLVLEKALTPDPGGRYKTADSMDAALEVALRGESRSSMETVRIGASDAVTAPVRTRAYPVANPRDLSSTAVIPVLGAASSAHEEVYQKAMQAARVRIHQHKLAFNETLREHLFEHFKAEIRQGLLLTIALGLMVCLLIVIMVVAS